MRLVGLRSSVLALGFAIACSSPEGPKPSPPSLLDGTWVAAAEDASPSGWYKRSLTFGTAGSFTSEFRSYGIYPGQPRDELSGYQRTEGSYEVDGDRITFHPARLVWWDRFYGVASPERIRELSSYDTIFDNARYEIQGGQLTLRFTIYPADAPEPAVLVYTQAP